MTEPVTCSVAERICRLTLSRPEKLNALNRDMFSVIAGHLDQFALSEQTHSFDIAAALAVLKKALKCYDRAEAIVTDGMRSYPAAV